jgi:hypothetical protein
MNVALVSCASLPDWEVDDQHLVEALARRGVVVERPAWSADVDWGRYAGALLRTPWDYSDQLDRFLAWADRAAAATSLWHGGPVLRWNLRKTYLAELEADGVPLAPTAWLAAGDSCDVAALCAARGWTAGLIKPVVGASARETLRFRPGELAAAQAHVDRLLPSEGLMVQPYLEAVEREGELSVILIDGVATHGVRKVPVPGDFRVQDDYGAHDEPYPVDGELGALAAQTVRARRGWGRGCCTRGLTRCGWALASWCSTSWRSWSRRCSSGTARTRPTRSPRRSWRGWRSDDRVAAGGARGVGG